MKAIVFDTEEHAKQWDSDNNSLTGSITKYKYNRVKLGQTTTLTKVEYAELSRIPEQLEDEDGNAYANPAYTSLDDSYTLHKYGLVVGSDFDTMDADGNVTPHPDVVDVTDMLYVSDGL